MNTQNINTQNTLDTKSKNILFLVIGSTPQIITETLWALACNPENPEPWIPTEIHVVSTEFGLNQVEGGLLANGIFKKMQQEFPQQLANVQFSKDNLTSITDENGDALNDLKTPEDNELAANIICSKIREFTSDPNAAVHVSIAGGRKTMGFYAGYALSLYGRAQDRMSHVLVDENYEFADGFYYPSTNPEHFAIKKIGNSTVQLPTHKAKVWLAQIPFVRLRGSLPKESLVATASFSEVVSAIDLAQNPIKLIVNENDRTVHIKNIRCQLAPQEYAFFVWFVNNKINQGKKIARPIEGVPYERAQEYLDEYKKVDGELKRNVDHEFFDQKRSKLARIFKSAFGIDLAEKITPNIGSDGKYDISISVD